MVTLSISEVAGAANSVDEGSLISSSIMKLLGSNDDIRVSFAGVTTASSSFATTAFIPALRHLGFEQFKRRIKVINATWQIADVVKRRILLELETA